jgi:hypothetical protein
VEEKPQSIMRAVEAEIGSSESGSETKKSSDGTWYRSKRTYAIASWNGCKREKTEMHLRGVPGQNEETEERT